MVFTSYNLAELRRCGDAFGREFKYSPSDIKSKHVLEWFRDTAPSGAQVYGRYSGNGEYMVDQCHTTYPQADGKEPWHKTWVRALGGPLQFRLALESEWGSERSHSFNLARVLDDAWKVAMLRAIVKVIIFATTTSNRARPIMDCLEKLRLRSGDVAPWLCIDIPWKQKWVAPRDLPRRVFQ